MPYPWKDSHERFDEVRQHARCFFESHATVSA